MPATLTIRQLREHAQLTPADIQRLTGGRVKVGALSAIEQGKVINPRADTLAYLAQALGVEMAACHAAIALAVAARKAGTPPAGTTGRPKAGRRTLQSALDRAREVVEVLEEQLAARSA